MKSCTLTYQTPEVAVIRFNRPKKMNAMNNELLTLWDNYLQEILTKQNKMKCLVITGVDQVFSSGADIGPSSDLLPRGRAIDLGEILAGKFYPIIDKLNQLTIPTIVAVNGPCVGVACALALYSDIIIASEDAYFWLNFIDIGLIPDGGSTYMLPRRIGEQAAFRMAVLAEKISAQQALQLGLVSAVYPQQALEQAWQALALRIQQHPSALITATTALLKSAGKQSLAQQLVQEQKLQTELGKQPYFRECIVRKWRQKKS